MHTYMYPIEMGLHVSDVFTETKYRWRDFLYRNQSNYIERKYDACYHRYFDKDMRTEHDILYEKNLLKGIRGTIQLYVTKKNVER